MGKSTRASKGKTCLGVFRSATKCKRARDQSGLPVLLSRNCPHCGEQRCRKHCRCGRNQTDKAKGRCAPRKSKRPVLPVATAAARAPVVLARRSEDSCVLVELESWYRQLCADIRSASQVELASYMYDDATVQKVLLKRLQEQKPLQLNVYIDGGKLRDGGPRRQTSRLRALHAAGAHVFICKGKGAQGSFHGKAAIVDQQCLYAGSANMTEQSHTNEEYCFRMTGVVVRQLLTRLGEQRQRSKAWNGV
jgi:hypothetical protein